MIKINGVWCDILTLIENDDTDLSMFEEGVTDGNYNECLQESLAG